MFVGSQPVAGRPAVVAGSGRRMQDMLEGPGRQMDYAVLGSVATGEGPRLRVAGIDTGSYF